MGTAETKAELLPLQLLHQHFTPLLNIIYIMVYKLFLHPPAPPASTGWQPQLRVRGCSSPVWLQAGSENKGKGREGSRSQQRPALGCPLEFHCHQDTLVGKPAQPSMNCLSSIKGSFHPPSARSLSLGWQLPGGLRGREMLSELLSGW